jgi:hypothetical protein
MQLLAKIAVSAVVFLALYFFSYWMFFVQILPDSALAAQNVLALLTGLAAAIAVWRGLGVADQGILATAATWAAIAGALGFCGGFFGPIVFTPEANQGPLLGIFITGPLGFFGGGLCGLIYAFIHRAQGRAVS